MATRADSAVEVPLARTGPRIPAALRGGSGLALLLSALLAVAAVGVALACSDEEASRPGVPEKISSADLRSLARATDHPVYWAGRSREDS